MLAIRIKIRAKFMVTVSVPCVNRALTVLQAFFVL